MEKIGIVGGGLAGSLIAVYLAKRGFEVTLYEKRPDMRLNRISAGRSINLALSERGINALRKVGLDKQVLETGIPMSGRMMHRVDGERSYQPYGKEGQAIYSVSRGLLNVKLLELADEMDNIKIVFDSDCVGANLKTGEVRLKGKDGNTFTDTFDYVIGSDGAFSAIRQEMQGRSMFNYSQTYLEHGYKELTIPAGPGNTFLLEKNCLHIWPRESFMLIALPNLDGSFTCTLFFQMNGPLSFESIDNTEKLDAFFDQYFADAKPLFEDLHGDFFNNPTGTLCTIRCYPWSSGKMTLVGDAAHAVVPFYGQGMNCSFEDCVVFDEMFDKFYPDWEQLFEAYEKSRKPNADAIADLALQNFVEMRDLVADEDFLHFKKVEHELTELYPGKFKSQYELVTFTNEPYSYAREQGARNSELVKKIIRDNLENKLNDSEFMDTLFSEYIK
ncbi:MAG: FAD-dependent monooxygenase [Flavobacteriales bacterium]|nr:FAD-dependent monooxygenase [Flavobacteriales bacterium]